MNKITSFGLLILVASMIFVGVTNTAFGETDPSILLTLAKRAQSQIQNQINEESPEEIKDLYNKGVEEIGLLEDSLTEEDLESAKQHFLNAMKIFTQLTHMTDETPTAEVTTQARQEPESDYSSDLERIQIYVSNLKILAKKYNAPIEFEKLDNLFIQAREQINSNSIDEIKETIEEIKSIVLEINNDIRNFAAKQQEERAKRYAQQYLEQLDRLIEAAKNQGVSEDIIQQLELARERLSTATNPQDIVREIKEIISIKKQFELTKNDRLESRVMQVQKTIVRLSQVEGINQTEIEIAKDSLTEIKNLLGTGEFDLANEMLRNLNDKLTDISKSLSVS